MKEFSEIVKRCQHQSGALPFWSPSSAATGTPSGIALLGDPVGWRFFTGGALSLGSAVTIQVEQALRGRNHSLDMNVREVA